MKYLPAGWESRTRIVYGGVCLQLRTLSKKEFLMTKCWAYCDRERDLEDILAMHPTPEEIGEVTEWLRPLDGNPHWSKHVSDRMNDIIQLLAEIDQK